VAVGVFSNDFKIFSLGETPPLYPGWGEILGVSFKCCGRRVVVGVVLSRGKVENKLLVEALSCEELGEVTGLKVVDNPVA